MGRRGRRTLGSNIWKTVDYSRGKSVATEDAITTRSRRTRWFDEHTTSPAEKRSTDVCRNDDSDQTRRKRTRNRIVPFKRKTSRSTRNVYAELNVSIGLGRVSRTFRINVVVVCRRALGPPETRPRAGNIVIVCSERPSSRLFPSRDQSSSSLYLALNVCRSRPLPEASARFSATSSRIPDVLFSVGFRPGAARRRSGISVCKI